jgi:hypothetical protein
MDFHGLVHFSPLVYELPDFSSTFISSLIALWRLSRWSYIHDIDALHQTHPSQLLQDFQSHLL